MIIGSESAMTFGSLFAGIGGFDLGLSLAGMVCKWQAELDASCQRVLGHHWPGTPQLGDVQDVGNRTQAVDLICGGFPCQDLSVAGRREGLAGERSGLWFEFLRVIEELKPKWVVVENVLGLLSSNGGRDMGAIVAQGQVASHLAWLIRFQWRGQGYHFVFAPLEPEWPDKTSSFGGKRRDHRKQAEYQMGRVAVHFVKAILTAAEVQPDALFGFLELPEVGIHPGGIPATAAELNVEGLTGVLPALDIGANVRLIAGGYN